MRRYVHYVAEVGDGWEVTADLPFGTLTDFQSAWPFIEAAMEAGEYPSVTVCGVQADGFYTPLLYARLHRGKVVVTTPWEENRQYQRRHRRAGRFLRCLYWKVCIGLRRRFLPPVVEDEEEA